MGYDELGQQLAWRCRRSAMVQIAVAASIMKSNADAEKSTVLTLLGAAQQNSSLANVGAAGIVAPTFDISALRSAAKGRPADRLRSPAR